MTTLSELLSTLPTPSELKDKWIVASKELRDTLVAKQETLNTNHHVSPVELTDGRWGACCDLLSATSGGQIFNQLFTALDQTDLMACEVVDTATFKALLPVVEEPI